MSSKKQTGLTLGPDIIINIKRALTLKSMSIKVNQKLVNINVPFFLSNKSIKQLIHKKISWIKKQLIIQEKTQSFVKKEYIDDEIFLYLGEIYKLRIIINKKYSVNIKDNYLIVNVDNELNFSKIKKLIKDWFFERSNTYLKEQTYYFAKKNDLIINSVNVKEYKARWGSCSSDGKISYNWRLIMAPPRIIEYVIIHELMHLKEHNHSKKYWQHVKSIYPNIKDAKEWLMYNGQILNI